jgi:hypothetical protein
VAVCFIGGGNWRKPSTCRKSLSNYLHQYPFFTNTCTVYHSRSFFLYFDKLSVSIIDQENLKTDLKKKRDEAIFQLRRHGEDRQKLEKEIYVAGCKLSSVLEENHKFEEVLFFLIL